MVRAAVINHPELQGAAAAQLGARGFTDEARAARRPQIVGQSDGGWRSFDPNRLLGIPERRYTSAGWGFTLRQLLYDFGAAEAAVSSAEARERIASARVEARRAELVLRAVQVALDLDSARLQLSLARENQAARAAIAQYVRDRYELGGGALSDVLRAQSRVADAQAGAIAALTRVEAAAASYREVFGAAPPESMAIPVVTDIAGLGSISSLASSFASVRAAIAAKEAAQAELKSVASRALPQLNLESSFTRRDQIGDGFPGNDRAALLNFRYEFYTGGAAQARATQAESRLDQAHSDYQAVSLAFERFATQAVAEANAAGQLMVARIEAVELAASSLRAVREQFAFRRGTLLDLLNAQEVLQAAGRDLIEAYAQQILSAYRLLYVASRVDAHFGFSN
jgi:adhesin transport system outer membrane protein